MTNKNTPYVKKIGKGRVVLNPITKATPYLNQYPTTRQKKENLKEYTPKPLTHYAACVLAFKRHKKDKKIKDAKKCLIPPFLTRNKYGIPTYKLKKSII